MIKLGIGKLACFDGSTANWKILNQADRYIHRGVERMGGTETMCVMAHPSTAITWGNTVEILLFKMAGGQPRFVYSETRKVDFSEDGQIGVGFYLQTLPWGSGQYKIRLMNKKVTVAEGLINLS